MDSKAHVYLIPGFFGFADLGGITYFHHVDDFLRRELAERGIEAEVRAIKTLPTASIRKRAGRLLQTVAATAEGDAPIHLVGHSTGGLDARLFLTPGASLDPPCGSDLEPLASRARSAVGIATPHFGTPMAQFFTSLLGAQLLYLLSLATVYTLQFGKLPLSMLVAFGGFVAKVDDHIGLQNTVLDQWYENLFSDFDAEREETIRVFLQSIREDQALVGQLTPGGIDLFNASTIDRGGVRYGSVVMKALEPGLTAMREIGLDPYRQASNVLYRALDLLTSGGRYPDVSPDHARVLRAAYGEVPDADAADGIVPTRSQLWGELIHAGEGDHLDACGHFDDPSRDPPHVDWIATGTGFDRAAFEALWRDVADFIADSQP